MLQTVASCCKFFFSVQLSFHMLFYGKKKANGLPWKAIEAVSFHRQRTPQLNNCEQLENLWVYFSHSSLLFILCKIRDICL